MNTEQFAYWLQGFVELHGEQPTQDQWSAIKDHLKLVFEKKTPAYTTTPYIMPDVRPQYVRHSMPSVPVWEPKITCSIGDYPSLADCVAKASAANAGGR